MSVFIEANFKYSSVTDGLCESLGSVHITSHVSSDWIHSTNLVLGPNWARRAEAWARRSETWARRSEHGLAAQARQKFRLWHTNFQISARPFEKSRIAHHRTNLIN